SRKQNSRRFCRLFCFYCYFAALFELIERTFEAFDDIFANKFVKMAVDQCQVNPPASIGCVGLVVGRHQQANGVEIEWFLRRFGKNSERFLSVMGDITERSGKGTVDVFGMMHAVAGQQKSGLECLEALQGLFVENEIVVHDAADRRGCGKHGITTEKPAAFWFP